MTVPEQDLINRITELEEQNNRQNEIMYGLMLVFDRALFHLQYTTEGAENRAGISGLRQELSKYNNMIDRT